jgi:hypothetical protein
VDEAEHRDASAPRTGGGRHRPWGTALAMSAVIVAFYLARERKG